MTAAHCRRVSKSSGLVQRVATVSPQMSGRPLPIYGCLLQISACPLRDMRPLAVGASVLRAVRWAANACTQCRLSTKAQPSHHSSVRPAQHIVDSISSPTAQSPVAQQPECRQPHRDSLSKFIWESIWRIAKRMIQGVLSFVNDRMSTASGRISMTAT